MKELEKNYYETLVIGNISVENWEDSVEAVYSSHGASTVSIVDSHSNYNM